MSFIKTISAAPLVFCLLSTPLVSAQSVDPAFQKARDERNKSIQTADAAVYDKYSTDNFIVIDPLGNVRTLADQNARFKAQSSRPPAAQAQAQPERMEERTDVYGDTIILNWAQKNNQGAINRFTEVWVKQNGIWKCAVAHASTAPEKK